MKKQPNSLFYQSKSGALELRLGDNQETLLATQQQVAGIFNVKKAAISKHVRNIFKSGELSKKATVSKMETVQVEGARNIKRTIEYYNLDLVLSIGYRVNSIKATKFRQWATHTLRSHIVDGYTLNKKRINQNYDSFLLAVDKVKSLLPNVKGIDSSDVLALVKMFATTWFSLDAYDKSDFTTKRATKKQVEFTAVELAGALANLKNELVAKKEASNLFGVERTAGGISGIVGNIFQSFGGKDVYPTIEEKAAHLLYFVVKNHPFTDGNKRSGAFAFVWFLKKAGLLDISRITPEALTALTLFVAESQPKDKEQMIGLILLLLSDN
jgi:prophage maintenance system killer protein